MRYEVGTAVYFAIWPACIAAMRNVDADGFGTINVYEEDGEPGGVYSVREGKDEYQIRLQMAVRMPWEPVHANWAIVLEHMEARLRSIYWEVRIIGDTLKMAGLNDATCLSVLAAIGNDVEGLK
jgi:hypothetical protein